MSPRGAAGWEAAGGNRCSGQRDSAARANPALAWALQLLGRDGFRSLICWAAASPAISSSLQAARRLLCPVLHHPPCPQGQYDLLEEERDTGLNPSAGLGAGKLVMRAEDAVGKVRRGRGWAWFTGGTQCFRSGLCTPVLMGAVTTRGDLTPGRGALCCQGVQSPLRWCLPSQGCCGRGSALVPGALKDRDLGCLLSMAGHSWGARGALTIIPGLMSCMWPCPKPPPACLPWGREGGRNKNEGCV